MSRRPVSNLKHKESILRAKSVRTGVEYKFFVNLNKGDNFKGVVSIVFHAIKNTDIFLDFCGEKICNIILNDSPLNLDDEAANIYNNGRITLPQAEIKVGEDNTVVIEFENKYYTDGNGLHTYTDIDGSQYVYIQSEPYFNNRVLPLFDQPNIKGRYTLVTLIPSDWIMISSKESETQQIWDGTCELDKEFVGQTSLKFDSSYTLWKFPQSKLLPTYLFFFAAGPFFRANLEESKRINDIPMSLYCKKTMKDSVMREAENCFEFHKKAIEYYSVSFGVDYMFSKCDMVVCPEYTIGAMEYPGSITYNDVYFPKSKNSVLSVSKRGRVILHEMAHMWFGNSVSIEWWNDTWLKESFADFIAYRCADDIKGDLPFPTNNAMLAFFNRKIWGYDEDTESTSHPIAGRVESTQAAVSVFDGISYSKGASVLKQLLFLVGMDNFKKAMKVYFKRHLWGNTCLNDLIVVFKEVLTDLKKENDALDIELWEEDWLKTAGCNTIECIWSQDQSEVTFVQSNANELFPKLRYHKIKVALFDQVGNVIRVEDVFIKNQNETVIDLGDLSQVSGIIPNHEDHGFILVKIDPKSREFFSGTLKNLAGVLDRMIVIKSYCDMAKRAEISPKDFVYLVLDNLSTKMTVLELQIVLNMLRFIVYNYMKERERKLVARKIFKLLTLFTKDCNVRVLFKAELLGGLFTFALDEKSVESIYSIYKAERIGFGKFLNKRLMWVVVVKVMNSPLYSEKEKNELYEEMCQLDSSESKGEFQRLIKAGTSSSEERLALFKQCLEPELSFSYYHLKDYLVGLNSINTPESKRAELLPLFVEKLVEIFRDRSSSIVRTFMRSFLLKADDLVPLEKGIVNSLTLLKEEDRFARKKMTQLLESVRLVNKSRAAFGDND